MNLFKFIATAFVFALLCLGCSTSQKSDAATIYYSRFDLFNLSGIDRINPSAIREKQQTEFVTVRYQNNIPDIIIYHFAGRKVSLKLENTFQFQDRNIYVYYTGNLLGGKAGRQREYSFHHRDNAYRLYIDLSDTLLVKNNDNIDVRSGNRYHYLIDVYIKKETHFDNYFLLQADTNLNILDDSLYNYWKNELKKTKPEKITNLNLFPPK